MRPVTCQACGSRRPHKARGWCRPCYARWLRHGRPQDGPPPPPAPRAPRAPRARHDEADEADEADEVAVARAVAGEPPARLSRAERRAAALVLRASGYSARAAAERIGCSHRTVTRLSSPFPR